MPKSFHREVPQLGHPDPCTTDSLQHQVKLFIPLGCIQQPQILCLGQFLLLSTAGPPLEPDTFYLIVARDAIVTSRKEQKWQNDPMERGLSANGVTADGSRGLCAVIAMTESQISKYSTARPRRRLRRKLGLFNKRSHLALKLVPPTHLALGLIYGLRVIRTV